MLEIPAGNEQTLQLDKNLARVDPNLPAVKGVITDAAGNLYISDSQNGVVEVPNPSGTPQTASAILISGVPAEGQVAIDSAAQFDVCSHHAEAGQRSGRCGQGRVSVMPSSAPLP